MSSRARSITLLFAVGALLSACEACDLAPPDWVLGTDAHGCQRYTGRWPSTACCNCPSDAGATDSGTE